MIDKMRSFFTTLLWLAPPPASASEAPTGSGLEKREVGEEEVTPSHLPVKPGSCPVPARTCWVTLGKWLTFSE